MPVIHVLGYMLLVLALTLVLWALLSRHYLRLRRRGHGPPLATLVLTGACGLGFAVAVSLIPSNLPGDNNHLFFLYYFCGPLLLMGASATAASFLLPSRNARVFGERQPGFPFVQVALALMGLAVLLAGGGLIVAFRRGDADVIKHSLKLATSALLPFGLYLLQLQRRLQAPSLPELLETDKRAPILYLRAFQQESQFFLIGPKSRYGAYASGLAASMAENHTNVGVTFEGYLAQRLNQSIGPFVALGSPEDYVPPDGATRTYATDGDWRERLRELTHRARCILVQVGRSANLRWELEYLRREGLHPKLFIVTRSKPPPGTRYVYVFLRLYRWLQGSPDVSWHEFADTLGTLGYQLPSEDPGPGAVLTFEPDGRSVLLTAEADLPSQYVAPIRAWLEGRERVGRHVRVRCASCGKRFHTWPTRSQKPRARNCRECRRAAQWKHKPASERWLEMVLRAFRPHGPRLPRARSRGDGPVRADGRDDAGTAGQPAGHAHAARDGRAHAGGGPHPPGVGPHANTSPHEGDRQGLERLSRRIPEDAGRYDPTDAPGPPHRA